MEIEDWRSGTGDRVSEIGDGRLEIGDWRLEIYSPPKSHGSGIDRRVKLGGDRKRHDQNFKVISYLVFPWNEE